MILIFLSKKLLEHYSWVQHKDSFGCVRDSPPIMLPIMVFVYPVAIWPCWLSSACDLLWFTDCFCQIPSSLFSSLNLSSGLLLIRCSALLISSLNLALFFQTSFYSFSLFWILFLPLSVLADPLCFFMYVMFNWCLCYANIQVTSWKVDQNSF